MSKNSLVLLVGCLVIACSGEIHQTQFYVAGKCEDCKAIIDAAAMEVRGVDSAGWDMRTNLLTVNFDTAKTNIEALQEAISLAGFATTYYEADSQARADLPLCCQEMGSPTQLIPEEAGLPTGH